LVVLIVLFTGVAQARAGDNAEIDRSIAGELGHESKDFGYFRLAVGPEVKTSVLVVADGDILRIDRKGDHESVGADEQVPLKDGRLPKPLEMVVGNTPVTIAWLDKWFGGFLVAVEVKGKRLQYGVVEKPARRREDAPLLRFDGLLVMGPPTTDPAKQRLRRGSKPYDFAAVITTAVPTQKGLWGPVINHTKYVPADAHPVAEFEFAPRKAGAAPIKLRAVLNLRGGGCVFRGPVSVPKEAASTKAMVTVSFPAWEEAHIAPATYEVPIEEVSPEVEAKEEREAQQRAEESRRSGEEMITSFEKRLEGEKDPRTREQLQNVIQLMKKQLQDMKKP
jgi:hypothetical protein